jgi:hypothetical protein
MAMTRDEFARLLSPMQLKFVWDNIQNGLASYACSENYSAEARLDHTPSVRAAIRNAHIVGCAKRMLLEQPDLGIRLSTKGNRVLFYFNEKARLSFKKLDENRRPRNYPTHQALAFNAQLWPVNACTAEGLQADAGQLWPSSMVPLMTNVVGGYVPNRAETEFEVVIVCPDGEGNAWEWSLNGAEIVELITIPDPATSVAANKITKRRVQIRPGAIRKRGNDGSEK